MRVVTLLSDVLGYDSLAEITSEQRIRERFVDFAVTIDGVTRFLIEVKAAGLTIRDRHIEQAEHYAAQGNIPWVLLTNATTWNLYHLTFDEGIDYERVFSVDLESGSLDEAVSSLRIPHRKLIVKGAHETFWKGKLALSPKSVGRALLTESVLRLIRREMRHQKGFLIDIEDLAKALHELFTPEAREQVGPAKIRKGTRPKNLRPRKVKTKPQEEADISDHKIESPAPSPKDAS